MKRMEFLTKMLEHMRNTAPEWLISEGQIRRKITNKQIFACAISSMEDQPVEGFKDVAFRLGLDPTTINDVVGAADYTSAGLSGVGKFASREIRKQMLEAIGQDTTL